MGGSRENEARLSLEVYSGMMRDSTHKLEHGKFCLDIRTISSPSPSNKRYPQVSTLGETQTLINGFLNTVLYLDLLCADLLRSIQNSMIMSFYDCAYLHDATSAHSLAVNVFHIFICNSRW